MKNEPIHNKILDFYIEEIKQYQDLPVDKLIEEEFYESLDDRQREKLAKRLVPMARTFLVSYNMELYKVASDDMNAINEDIVGVIDGRDIGRTNTSGGNYFVCVVTTQNVYVYTRANSATTGAFGMGFGLLGGLISMAAKGTKAAVKPFNKETYSLREFYDNALIGIDYFGFGCDISNWSFGKFFKKYHIQNIFRPIYRRILNDVEKILNGEYMVETKQSPSFSQKSIGYIEELKQLKGLLDQGIITQSEFDEKKSEILKNKN